MSAEKKAYDKAYYEANKEKIIARTKAWNEANKEKYKAYNKDYNKKHQVKVNDTLKFLTKSSKIYRQNINAKIIAITGSCGKTSLK